MKQQSLIFSLFIGVVAVLALCSCGGENAFNPSFTTGSVTGNPNFSMTITPSNQTVFQGDFGDFTVTVTPVDGFDSPVTLSVSGLSQSGFSSDLEPVTVTPTAGGSDVRLRISNNIGQGQSSRAKSRVQGEETTFTVNGVGGGKTQSVSGSVTDGGFPDEQD